ncbi:hypothetical protein BX265_0879 [Streptomyces sp. TLI_235]|nr:hypothetical protein [Streptomyces sp. TLI_235]PBC76176.1 hypothetical protein BX265_0879 [Streptomyces sp. TLI_235]
MTPIVDRAALLLRPLRDARPPLLAALVALPLVQAALPAAAALTTAALVARVQSHPGADMFGAALAPLAAFGVVLLFRAHPGGADRTAGRAHLPPRQRGAPRPDRPGSPR